MATRRKPVPMSFQNTTGLSDAEFHTTSTSTITRDIRDQLHNKQPYRSRSNNDLRNIGDNEPPPPYTEPSVHQPFSDPREPDFSPGGPLLRPCHSVDVLSEHVIITPTQHPSSSLRIDSTNLSTPASPLSSSSATSSRPKLVTAIEETSFFLGGLISHPIESTKHFTILRHSHGLVYYKGPNTSLAISIFSDRPLPHDRQLWLQLKGWSGNTGMAVKALFGSNDNWINVTPEREVYPNDLPSLDERAWQRDIKKFTAKATKAQQKHVLRETDIVRIPFEASDGYFRLVLTTGDSKSVVCPSPVFRVASTSLSASCMKGASLTTLPLELGVKAATTAANVVVSKATAAATPLRMAAKDRVMNVAPVKKYGGHAQSAWDMSGMQDRVTSANQQFGKRREERPVLDRTVSAPATLKGNIIGDEAGPMAPFPVRLSGQVAKGTGKATAIFRMPTANLGDLPLDILSSISTGVYFGWALVVAKEGSKVDLYGTWQQAIISVSFTSSSSSKVAQRKTVQSHLLHNFPSGTTFVGFKLKLVIMGYLRPLTPDHEQDVFLLETVNDIAITRASLARPAWSHEQVLQRVRTAQAERGITDRIVDIRVAGQRHVDKVPIHMLGVRNETTGMHDRGVYGNGGMWVKRD